VANLLFAELGPASFPAALEILVDLRRSETQSHDGFDPVRG